MAIEHKISDLLRAPQSLDPAVEAMRMAGKKSHATGTVANAAADSSGSTYKLCEVPSYAMLVEDTFFDVEAWGFAQIVIGTKTDATALVNQTKATETIVQPVAIGDANHGKRLWEVLGMANDPGGNIGIYVHAAANATGAGSMPFRISWMDQD